MQGHLLQLVDEAIDEQCFSYYAEQQYSPGNLPIVTVADSFYPGAYHTESDLTLITVDQVLFYLSIEIVCKYSHNAFKPLIANADMFAEGERLAQIPETSEVVDAMAHFLYALPYAGQAPSLRTFIDAILAMPKYEIDASAYLVPNNPCYNIILAFTPLFPLEVYALAAQFDIEHLAASASSHLLSLSLPDISDEMANQVGAIYLKRLFSLHAARVEAFKSIVVPGPYPHAPAKHCDFAKQKKLVRAWYLVAAHLIWDPRPDLSTGTIMSAFNSLGDLLDCSLCREALQNRVKNVIAQWVVVKRMI